MHIQMKKELPKAKQKVYDQLYERLDTKGGENNLYLLMTQRDPHEKDVRIVKMIKDMDRKCTTIVSENLNVLRRLKK